MWAPTNTATREKADHRIPTYGAHPNYKRVTAPAPPIATPIRDNPAAAAGRPVEHPAFGRGARLQSIARPKSDESATADTVALMAQFIAADATAPQIQAATAEAVAGIPAEQLERRIAAVHRWIRSHIEFKEDSETAGPLSGLGFTPAETEVLIRPADILKMPKPAGDCDDFTMLAGAMLTALEIPVALVTIAADPAAPDVYSHVYLLAHTPSGAIAVDASHGREPGWFAQPAGKAKIWEVPLIVPHRGGMGVYIDWNALIQTGATAGADIARQVTLPSGSYQARDANGASVTLRQQSGAGAFALPTGSAAISSGVLLAVAALFGVLLLARSRS
jgi:hypothetical protein